MAQRREIRRQELEQQNTSQLLRMPYDIYIERLVEWLVAAGYVDIHPAHAIVFQHVPGEGVRVTDLAERAQLTKQYMGRLVAELEELGYLERTPDPTDGRAKLVRLSARGWEITRVAEEIITSVEAAWVEAIGEEAYIDLRRRLVDLLTALGAGAERAPEPSK